MRKFFILIVIIFLNNVCCFAAEKGVGIEAIRKGLFIPLQIRSIQTNSPADKAKLPLNWYIISIDGRLTKDLPNYTCLDLLNNHVKTELMISPIPTIYSENAVKITITNEEGFSNIVKDVPRTKGIGIGVRKYDLNLVMPLFITEVEKGSPADTAGIQKNMLILKINNQQTKDLSFSEYKKLLNKKNIELEISDLNGNNPRIYKLKSQYYYANNVNNTKIDSISGIHIVTLIKYNPYEKVISEYFKVFNPKYIGKNGITVENLLQKDKAPIEQAYSQYKTNKNDMKFNKYLYDGLNTFTSQYKELIQMELKPLKEAFISNGNLATSTNDNEFLNYIKSSEIPNSEYFISYIEYLKNYINTCCVRAKEVKDYSVAYEIKQKKALPKVTTPYFVDNVDFREILWGWQTAKRPQKNGIYIITPQTGAKVFQSVSGGVLLTSDVSRLSNPRIIYVATKKQFVDDEWIKDGMVIVFEGYYTYYNALGSMNKIYKFKEVPQAEYWNRVKTNTYYFIK